MFSFSQIQRRVFEMIHVKLGLFEKTREARSACPYIRCWLNCCFPESLQLRVQTCDQQGHTIDTFMGNTHHG